MTKDNETIFTNCFSEEVWNNTYKYTTDNNINDTFHRVAKALASVEKNKTLREEWVNKFYDMLCDFKIVPGGRILANAGTNDSGVTLINCFFTPEIKPDPDSITGIYKMLHKQAQTLKSEGGYGASFNHIRPRGAFIKGIRIDSPGVVKFMELFDKSSEIITSGSGLSVKTKNSKSKIRKGAQIGIISCWHPSIEEFIRIKRQQGKLTKFNISVDCTDEFMQKVVQLEKMKNDKAPKKDIDKIDTWDLIFPETTFSKYKSQWNGDIKQWKEKGYPIVVYKTVKVSFLWNLIMESTYKYNDPGVVFLDRANYYNPSSYIETIKGVNPCGEISMSHGNTCCLSSINLTQFVDIKNKTFDFKRLKPIIKTAIRFLDNVLSYSDAPLKEYKKSMVDKRRIGLGILGWGSSLMMMKIKFGSDEADTVRNQLMEFISKNSYESSIDLAQEKGSFSMCDPEQHSNGIFIKNLKLSTQYMKKLKTQGIRNSAVLMVAPTGNTGILANNVSGGIEPVFMPEYIRTVIVNNIPEDIIDVTPKWFMGEWEETDFFKFKKEGNEQILRGTKDGIVYKIDMNRGLTKEILCQDYAVTFLKDAGEWNPKAEWVCTTDTLTPKEHLNDLAGFMKYVDNSISKTINVPNKFSYADFKNIYLDAYKTNLIKGITTYRSGTMTSVLSVKEEKDADQSDEEIIKEDVKLPDSSPAAIKTLRADGKKYYVTVVYHEHNPSRPFALFVKTNNYESKTLTYDTVDLLLSLAKTKKIPKRHRDIVIEKISKDNNADKVARLISFLLRHGVLVKNIVAALNKVENAFVGTFVFQIRKFLTSYIKDGEIAENESCNECGGKIVYSEGCFKCFDCGVSKC